MALADEVHRLRNEWDTYAQAGFSIQKKFSLPQDLVSDYPATTESGLTLAMFVPQSASSALAEDSIRWLARWMLLLAQLANPCSPAYGDED